MEVNPDTKWMLASTDSENINQNNNNNSKNLFIDYPSQNSINIK